MSRVGKYPVPLPKGVNCSLKAGQLLLKGKLGEITVTIPQEIDILLSEDEILVKPLQASKKVKMLWGTIRSLISNTVKGISEGFIRKLELEGVGYRAAVQGNFLKLQLGYSHDINFPIPEGVQIKCEKPTSIIISGADYHQVGQVAANIKSYRKLEPYKGKGIKEEGQFVLRKEGKKK